MGNACPIVPRGGRGRQAFSSRQTHQGSVAPLASQAGQNRGMQILRASDYRVVPWKIGKGLSRVIASRPPGAGYEDLLWHVSLPEITADCPSHGW